MIILIMIYYLFFNVQKWFQPRQILTRRPGVNLTSTKEQKLDQRIPRKCPRLGSNERSLINYGCNQTQNEMNIKQLSKCMRMYLCYYSYQINCENKYYIFNNALFPSSLTGIQKHMTPNKGMNGQSDKDKQKRSKNLSQCLQYYNQSVFSSFS